MEIKKQLGQFNTTRKDYILKGFEDFLMGKDVVDPFAGAGDLLPWAWNAQTVTGYDVDPTLPWITNDSLLNPIDYQGKWIITNPPYLARNKNPDKTIYDKYDLDDLYKCSIRSMMGCEGGILIVPVNFLSAETSAEIRSIFFEQYDILDCKVFEERVFDDTDYTVCAFSFKKAEYTPTRTVSVTFMPSGRVFSFQISANYSWIFGEAFHEFVNIDHPKGIGRYTLENCVGDKPMKAYVGALDSEVTMNCSPDVEKNIILLRAIDTGTQSGRIKLMNIREHGISCLAGKSTSRNYAQIKFDNPPTIEQQLEIIEKFNTKLEWYREQYNSIFLTAFRNSTKEYSRKRISFDVVYKMISKLLS
jgi:hypothetical protein